MPTQDEAYVTVLHKELMLALKKHENRRREPWSGPFHFMAENEEIGHIRTRVDQFLGIKPGTVGNDEALRMLSAFITKEKN